MRRVALVTGGAQGIGRACVWRLASQGYGVVFSDISLGTGRLVEAEWKASGGKGSVTFLHGDASKGDAAAKLVQSGVATYGRVDVLVNNVGIQPQESCVRIHELPKHVWDQVLDTNLTSIYWMCYHAIPVMLKQQQQQTLRGDCAIINMSSIHSLQSQVRAPAYASSKGAINALTRQLAMDYGRDGIRVNSVSPGSVLTPLMRANTDCSYAQSNTALNRLGEPADIAELVAFLADPEKAGWMTGQNLVCDGGITSKGGWNPLPAPPPPTS